jgi:NifB/MoaA-like Fe-S oxidoreductase
VLDQIEPWREQNRTSLGCNFVYPSDEWYLVAEREIPSAGEYDDFPQVENGVGMVRQLLDEWAELKADLPASGLKSATIVCGTLVAPVMRRIVDALNKCADADWQVVPVVNQFFGPVTTVSGLLTGQDVVRTLRGHSLGEIVLLPRAMFITSPQVAGQYGAGLAPPGTTLDDMHVDEIASRLGARVAMANTMEEALARALR